MLIIKIKNYRKWVFNKNNNNNKLILQNNWNITDIN